MIRWYLDLAIVGRTVIGKVWQTVPAEDVPKGSIRPSAPWKAVGMLNDWADTEIGQHASRQDAMRAITEWWEAVERSAGQNSNKEKGSFSTRTA